MERNHLFSNLFLVPASINLAHCFNSASVDKACQPSSYIRRNDGQCSKAEPDCCKPRKPYPQYVCSPPITNTTLATMTLKTSPSTNDYRSIGCDDRFHTDSELVVALSTGWYNGGSRCLKNIKISAIGRTVVAKVVDVCDSVYGCDVDHNYRQPCSNNIVDASPAVWEALGIPNSQFGQINVTWSDHEMVRSFCKLSEMVSIRVKHLGLTAGNKK